MASKKNSIIYNVLANTTSYKGSMEDTVKYTDAASKAIKRTFIAITAVVTGSAIAFGKFEKGMASVSTIIDTTVESIGSISQSVLQIGRDVPKPISELVTSMYDIRSAGIAASKAVGTLKAAGVLAVSGLSTTKEATDILTTSLNVYADEGRTAAEISNILFKTVKFGKNTIAELAQSFGQTAPLVKSAGVGLIEFSAGVAALTAQGIPASVSQNQLRAAMVGLQRQTASMRKVFDALGEKDMKSLMGNSNNLGDAFGKIVAQAKAMGIPLTKVTGRVEGANAMTVIAGAGADIYTKALKDMEGGSDAVSVAFAKQTKTLDSLRQKLFNFVNITMINLGSKLAPALISVGGMIVKLFDAIDHQITKNGAAITTAFSFIADTGMTLFNTLKNGLTIVADFFNILGGYQVVTLAAVAFRLVATALNVVFTVVKTVTSALSDLIDDMGLVGSVMKAGLAVFAGAQLASVATVIFAIVKATKLWAAAQWALNVAMKANPIGIIIAAVVALGALAYDLIVNFNEWKLSFNSLINSAIIGWKKAKALFESGEREAVLNKEIAALEKENRLIEAQTTALKKRKDELKAKGISSFAADKQAGGELKSGKLDKSVNKQLIADEKAKTGIVAKGEADRNSSRYDALTQAQLNKDAANAVDVARVEEWYALSKGKEATRFEEEQALLLAQKEQGLLSDEEYLIRKEEMEAAHYARLQAQSDTYNTEKNKKQKKSDTFFETAKRKANANVVSMQDGMYSDMMFLLEAYAGKSKAAAIAFKAISIGEAVVSTYLGASKALATVPFPYNMAAAGLITAKGMLQVAQIKNQSFAVGTDFIEKDMQANVHKGEGIIPAKQNQFLQSGKLALVAPGALQNNSGGSTGNVSDTNREAEEIEITLTLKDELVNFIEAGIVRNRRLGIGVV